MRSPLIVKWRYWDNSKARANRASNFLSYIGTRKGVEKLDDTFRTRSVSEKQKAMITKLISDVPSSAESEEYYSYVRSPTMGTAHDFISFTLENNPRLFEKKTYLDYIGTRPRVEKTGEHGLFSDEGTIIDLEEERKKLNSYDGIVHTLIISLSREDAENTGFNCAERYRSFMRTHKFELAKQFGIPPGNMKWFGAFHNEGTHPHIHVLLYSDDENRQCRLRQEGLEQIKRMFATEIFRNELDTIYNEQTERRDELTRIARDEIAGLVLSVQNDHAGSKKLEAMMLELAEKLKTVRGKKVYGYLPADIKTLVDDIADELMTDARLKKLYGLWYESKYSVMRMYTEHLPDMKPLSQEMTFRAIKNSIIREADSLNLKTEPVQKAKSVPLAVSNVLYYASKIIQDDIYVQFDAHPEIAVDSKLRREIEAKKMGINTLY